jgi:hypothetical protein
MSKKLRIRAQPEGTIVKELLNQGQLIEIHEQRGAWIRHALGWSVFHSSPTDSKPARVFAVELGANGVGKPSIGEQMLSIDESGNVQSKPLSLPQLFYSYPSPPLLCTILFPICSSSA